MRRVGTKNANLPVDAAFAQLEEMPDINADLIRKYKAQWRQARAERGKGAIIALVDPGDATAEAAGAALDVYAGITRDVPGVNFVVVNEYRGDPANVDYVLYHSTTEVPSPFDQYDRGNRALLITSKVQQLAGTYPRADVLYVPLYYSNNPILRFDTEYFSGVNVAPMRLTRGVRGNIKVEGGASDSLASVKMLTRWMRQKIQQQVYRGFGRFLQEEIGEESRSQEEILGMDRGDYEAEQVNGYFGRYLARYRIAKLERQPRDTIHAHFKAWLSKYEGAVLRWFISWVDAQNYSAPRISLRASYALFARAEGVKVSVPVSAPKQILNEFGVSGKAVSLEKPMGNILMTEDARWLRKQLEAQRASEIVVAATTVAYEKAVDDAEKVIETVVEKDTQQASAAIDKLTAQIKSDKEKLEMLLKENKQLREDLTARTEEVKTLRGQVSSVGSTPQAGPPPPPPPPQTKVTQTSINNDEEEAERLAKAAKDNLEVAPEDAEKKIREGAGDLFNSIGNVDFSEFMEQGAQRRLARENAAKKLSGDKPMDAPRGNPLFDGLAQALKTRRGAIRPQEAAGERIFAHIKEILGQIADGSMVITHTGHLKTADKTQVPCMVCESTPTVGDCMELPGRFCSDECLQYAWENKE